MTLLGNKSALDFLCLSLALVLVVCFVQASGTRACRVVTVAMIVMRLGLFVRLQVCDLRMSTRQLACAGYSATTSSES